MCCNHRRNAEVQNVPPRVFRELEPLAPRVAPETSDLTRNRGRTHRGVTGWGALVEPLIFVELCPLPEQRKWQREAPFGVVQLPTGTGQSWLYRLGSTWLATLVVSRL